ncbi:hypothetical protein CIB48_g7560 [Xylaria polymorpha]|nr:hypothetical protein CIB48_g7560 [Xylaria polymorpha]
MCWSGIAFNHCYECSREFDHKAHTTPCHASENGQPCALKQLPHYIIHTGENCAECKAAREAEEACQRNIYHSRPLNLDLKDKTRMRALLAAYRQDMRARKWYGFLLPGRAAVQRGAVGIRHHTEESFVVTPMLIMGRHQFVSYVKTDPSGNLT